MMKLAKHSTSILCSTLGSFVVVKLIIVFVSNNEKVYFSSSLKYQDLDLDLENQKVKTSIKISNFNQNMVRNVECDLIEVR